MRENESPIEHACSYHFVSEAYGLGKLAQEQKMMSRAHEPGDCGVSPP